MTFKNQNFRNDFVKNTFMSAKSMMTFNDDI